MRIRPLQAILRASGERYISQCLACLPPASHKADLGWRAVRPAYSGFQFIGGETCSGKSAALLVKKVLITFIINAANGINVLSPVGWYA
jgi:hypothetical protein